MNANRADRLLPTAWVPPASDVNMAPQCAPIDWAEIVSGALLIAAIPVVLVALLICIVCPPFFLVCAVIVAFWGMDGRSSCCCRTGFLGRRCGCC